MFCTLHKSTTLIDRIADNRRDAKKCDLCDAESSKLQDVEQIKVWSLLKISDRKRATQEKFRKIKMTEGENVFRTVKIKIGGGT